MQSAWNGCGGERERVHIFAHFLEALFVGDAEALLFIDDEKTEVGKFHIFRKQAMRADDHVHLARFQIRENFFLLRGAAKAAEHFDARGESGEPFLERFEMLEGKNSGRRENRDLLVVHYGFERRAHGDFCFAVADVSAKEAVHGLGAFHVALDVTDGGDLVGGFLEFERVFEFTLEIAVGGEGKTFGGLAFGVKSEKLVGHVFDGFARARLASVPDGAAEPVQRGMRTFENAVTLDEVHALEGNIEARIVGVLQEHEFAIVTAGFNLAKAFELADAVIHVDDVVSGFEFGKIAEETGGADFAAGALDGGSDVEKIGVAEERDVGFGKGDAFGERSANQQHSGGFVGAFGGESGGGVFGFAENVGDFVFAADIGEALDFPGAGGGEENGSAGSKLGLDVGHAGNNVAVETSAGPGGKLELRSGTDSEGELFDANLR